MNFSAIRDELIRIKRDNNCTSVEELIEKIPDSLRKTHIELPPEYIANADDSIPRSLGVPFDIDPYCVYDNDELVDIALVLLFGDDCPINLLEHYALMGSMGACATLIDNHAFSAATLLECVAGCHYNVLNLMAITFAGVHKANPIPKERLDEEFHSFLERIDEDKTRCAEFNEAMSQNAIAMYTQVPTPRNE